MRVLVVEDNRSLVANLFDYLEPRGCVLDAAPDGRTGLHLALSQDFDVLILDWMLPGMDGYAVLQELRRCACAVPVLMLTARDELPDKLAGFHAGADDYLTKPFALPELEVRLHALVARARGGAHQRSLRVADLCMELDTLEVLRDGRPVHLYPACRTLLEVLMRSSPAAVTRERLERALWGEDPPDGDVLRSHIYELRRAIESPGRPKLLHTLPRIGYRLGLADPEAGP